MRSALSEYVDLTLPLTIRLAFFEAPGGEISLYYEGNGIHPDSCFLFGPVLKKASERGSSPARSGRFFAFPKMIAV
jgi:hypothetical protein